MPKGRRSQHRHRNRRQKLAAIANRLPNTHPFARFWERQRQANLNPKVKNKRSIDRKDRKNASKGHSVKRRVG